jgi:glycosyltransferase involved in cell wall biosynthesis
MARAAQAAGFEVHVATRVRDGAAAIAAENFVLHPLEWQRGSTSLLTVVRAVHEVRRLYHALSPDLVHHVALWPSVVGSLAALGSGRVRLNALAGLGYAFTGRSTKAKLLRGLLKPTLRVLFDRSNSAILVQNPDDRETMLALGISPERIALVPGSGIETDQFIPMKEPAGVMTVGFVGRLLEDKGIRALVEAHEILRNRGRSFQLLIAGKPDPANPASIAASTIDEWKQRPGIVLLGHVADVRIVWAAAQIAVLPSRREGLPRSLLEAAACGRPIVATDVPGCREIAVAGVNALLVPVDDPAALADAINTLISSPNLRRSFGEAGRRLVEENFSAVLVGCKIVELYRQLLAKTSVRLPGKSAPI